MAFTTITNAAVAAGAAVTTALMTALRDNLIAVIQGDNSSPGIWLPALERLEAGDDIRSRLDTPGTTALNAVVTLINFGVIQIGTIRCRIEKTGGSQEVFVDRVRNGTVTVLGSSTSVGILTVDAPVIAGDAIRIRAGSAGGVVSYQNARLSTNGQELWPGTSARLEGNRSV